MVVMVHRLRLWAIFRLIGSQFTRQGTLSGNPVAMAAGIAQLSELLRMGFYRDLHNKTEEFTESIQRFAYRT